METHEAFEEFIGYLSDKNDKSWVECGLVKNAPENAKQAYERWVKQEKERIERGIL